MWVNSVQWLRHTSCSDSKGTAFWSKEDQDTSMHWLYCDSETSSERRASACWLIIIFWLLSSENVLVHYNEKLPIGISCDDLSSVSIETFLFHQCRDRSECPISNILKILMESQNNSVKSRKKRRLSSRKMYTPNLPKAKIWRMKIITIWTKIFWRWKI